jgi:hypothetical protein
MTCEWRDLPDIELYFYGDLDWRDRSRVRAHLRTCAACRQRLLDLETISRELAPQPVVAAPPAGDWSGFMRRLDAAVAATSRAAPVVVLERRHSGWSVRQIAALAAMLTIAALGVFMAARVRRQPAPAVGTMNSAPAPSTTDTVAAAHDALTPDAALREISAEHLQRSKLVVLGLAARDPRHTQPADWQYERKLAGTLLPETRLYRLAAQERGASDVARVMRDLETVLLETSMSDHPDRESLERVQRLIARRGLVAKMQVVANSPGL